MRIYQLLPMLGYGDAIGNDALAIRDIISRTGCETGIFYAEFADRRLPPGTAKHVNEMPALEPEDILIYHMCTGAKISFRLPEFGGRKVMIYHNITPPHFFHKYNRDVEKIQEYAYEGLQFLSDKIDYCIADSEYNKQDLIRMGYQCPIDVCPIVIPYADYDARAKHAVMRKMRGDGKKNILFVGRVAPNKKQEDVIRAFACYHERYEPKSRLILIGSAEGMDDYLEMLQTYIRKLRLEDSVLFPGHIAFDEILAYYRTADVFVCMSEHEGFCVPLIEAMYFHVPIVAFRSTAVPDTLGEGGLLLDSKDPDMAAAAIDRVMKDEALRKTILEKQEEKLSELRYEAVSEKMTECIKRIQGPEFVIRDIQKEKKTRQEKKMGIFGRIGRKGRKITGAVINAPERFDLLAERIDQINRKIDGQLDDQRKWFDKRVKENQGQIDFVHMRIDSAEKRLDGIDARGLLETICEDRDLLSRLNRSLSIAPTIWGDPQRLEIDETASMFTCFFNTTSGRIKVGESTFAGSGVSILAGSHDPQLTGFLRRDTVETEGYDIEIGNGVWLASGCTLLGPCRIGDNAVVAAGALVTPGSEIPANEIWGGVPARKIGEVAGNKMTPDNPAVKRAFEHSDGMLFTDGWGESVPGYLEVPGHRLYKQSAGIITDRAEWKMLHMQKGQEQSTIRITGPAGETEVTLNGLKGEETVRLPMKDGKLSGIRIAKGGEEEILIAFVKAYAAEDSAQGTGGEQGESGETGTADIEKIMDGIRAEAAEKDAGEEPEA